MNIELLKKLQQNKCTDEELYKIYHWLSTPEKEAEASAFLKSSWQQVSSESDIPEDMVSVSKMREQIWNRIGHSDEKMLVQPDNSTKYHLDFFKQGMKAAAIVVLIIATGIVFYNVNIKQEQSSLETSVTYIEKSNPRGQKSTVFLSDGSKVILNSSSSIRYASDFGESNRDITLNGEAFFEVAENREIPFNVISEGVTTTALGTSFNIRAYKYLNQVKVSLVTGKTVVRTANDAKEYFLNPGQSLLYNLATNGISQNTFNPKETLSWKDGILYFNNKKFGEVIKILEEWYDVSISVDYGNTAKVKQDDIQGEFKNESLNNVLKVMQYSRDFDYEISGKRINIYFK